MDPRSQPLGYCRSKARGEGRLARLIAALEHVSLLILDDWGPEPLTADQRRDLLEIVDDRYDKGSLLITSQLPVSQWHDVIADPPLGDAILGRIIHNAHRLELKGDSLRRHAGVKKKPRSPRARSRPRIGPSLVGALRARTWPSHGPPERSPNRPASLEEETLSGTLKAVNRVRLK
jgi:IstB-like ATP binding protein